MYKSLVRPLLFLFDPEKIHAFTFGFLRVLAAVPGALSVIRLLHQVRDPRLERVVFGVRFQNPVGLAAGFDKDAKLIDALAGFGFGFIEIGTLTPKGQPGNEKPRLFRLREDGAIINRMGFNNEGVLHAVKRLKNKKTNVVIGGNIGKNKATPNELAFEDYNYCFEALYPHVDYFVVNVSSPNTPGLRQLQEKEPLKKLLLHVRGLSQAKEKPKPVLLKIAPDLTVEQLDDIIDVLKETKLEGVIATNTTISREMLRTSKERIDQIGAGGLSGKPLTKKSTEIISYLRKSLGADFSIIGVGGIMNPQDAIEKLQGGADLIQVYSGFIYEGPGLIKAINKAILKSGSAQ